MGVVGGIAILLLSQRGLWGQQLLFGAALVGIRAQNP